MSGIRHLPNGEIMLDGMGQIDPYYVDMARWYRPQFEKGMLGAELRHSDTYFTLRDARALNGLGELSWSSVFGGPSQATLNRIMAVQNQIVIRSGEVNAANQVAWDAIWSQLQGKSIPDIGGPFYGWQWTKDNLIDMNKLVTVTPSYTPKDADTAKAEDFVRQVGNMVTYFKRIVPEQAAKIAADAAFFKQKVEAITPMKSPADVGVEAFKKDIAARAAALTSSFSFGVGAAVVVAGILAVILLGGKK